MLTKADDYLIHQLPVPAATPGTTDRNFYERYYFDGLSPDGKTCFIAAQGVYPLLDLTDASFMIQRDGIQHSIFSSRHLAYERLDLRVSPMEVRVLEPLKKLQFIVEPNEYGISAEITATGRTAPAEDDRLMLTDGPRVMMNTFRLLQHMDLSGWIEILGERIDLRGWCGTRDRSWGVRPIGIRDPQSLVPPRPLSMFWLCGPQIYTDYSVYFHTMDDEHGNPRSRMCALHATDGGEPRRLCDVGMRVSYRSGTRLIDGVEIHGRLRDAGEVRIEYFPEELVGMQGAGFNHPAWSPGMYHGDAAREYQTFDMRELDIGNPNNAHLMHLCRARLYLPGEAVREGRALLEQVLVGPHAPSGFRALFDGAS